MESKDRMCIVDSGATVNCAHDGRFFSDEREEICEMTNKNFDHKAVESMTEANVLIRGSFF